jgi:hypothetical protein
MIGKFQATASICQQSVRRRHANQRVAIAQKHLNSTIMKQFHEVMGLISLL